MEFVSEAARGRLRRGSIIFLSSSLALMAAFATAQNKANWKLADRFSSEALRPYVYSSTVTPGWINKTDTFWYSWKDENGLKFYLVDPAKKSKKPLFDSAKMAALLSEAVGKPYDTTNLPITTVTFNEAGDKINFTVDTKRFEYDIEKQTLKKATAPAPPGDGAPPPTGRIGGGRGQGRGGGNRQDYRNFSPDKKAYVYAEENNLYYVDMADEKNPIQLTKDGEKDRSFGSKPDADTIKRIQDQRNEQRKNGGGGTKAQQDAEDLQLNNPRVRANVTWSPDSKTFFVDRTDMRKVKDLYLVNNLAEPRPALVTYKYPMPGEPEDGVQEAFVLTADKKALRPIDLKTYHEERALEMHWTEKGDKLRFIAFNRTQRQMELDELTLSTSVIKPLLTEQVDNAYLEREPIRYFKKKDGDFLWWSERDGWGHLYLYDNNGKLKNRVTEGPWRVDDVVDVDEDKGTIWFHGVGREKGENPYYRHLYRVDADGKNLRILDPGNSDHNTRVSTNHKYFVDTASRVDLAPETTVYDIDGNKVMDLEQQDIGPLTAWGWKAPEVFNVKSDDGVTDIYGVMWKPVDFDKNKKYPIIAYVYPGPQTESVITTFSPTNVNQRLSNLGFIVIEIGNRGGNPARSNAYHSYGYFNLRDYGLADKKAGIEQLAARYNWIDIDKVGIFGHSGGGFMTAAALLEAPYNNFFKVGVSSSGNHDNNIYNSNWSEQHHGLKEVKDKDGNVKYEIHVPTNIEIAAGLKGNLMLVTGDMDNNVHPANTIRLVNALINAGKRFDFMIMPGQAHGYGPMNGYFQQRMMEYFSTHLLGDRYDGSEITSKQ